MDGVDWYEAIQNFYQPNYGCLREVAGNETKIPVSQNDSQRFGSACDKVIIGIFANGV